jgi:hypothetical protein
LTNNLSNKQSSELLDMNRTTVYNLRNPKENIKHAKIDDKKMGLMINCFTEILDNHRSNNILTYSGYKKTAIQEIIDLIHKRSENQIDISVYFVKKMFKILHVHRKNLHDLFSCDDCNPRGIKKIDKLIIKIEALIYFKKNLLIYLTCCRIKSSKNKMPKVLINFILGKENSLNDLISFKNSELFKQYLHKPIRNVFNSDITKIEKLNKDTQKMILEEVLLKLNLDKLMFDVHVKINYNQRNVYNKIKDNLSSDMIMVIDWTLFETRIEKKGRILTLSIIFEKKIFYFDYFFQDDKYNDQQDEKDKKKI